jgi:hypothetical protein
MASKKKDTERGSRFSNPMGIKKGSDALVDQRLLEELGEMALKACKSDQKVFADCAKKWNMAVVFMCRGENDRMNECFRQYTNDDALAAYKETKNKAQESSST